MLLLLPPAVFLLPLSSAGPQPVFCRSCVCYIDAVSDEGIKVTASQMYGIGGQDITACVSYAAGIDPTSKFVPKAVVDYVKSSLPECLMVVALKRDATGGVDEACGRPRTNFAG